MKDIVEAPCEPVNCPYCDSAMRVGYFNTILPAGGSFTFFNDNKIPDHIESIIESPRIPEGVVLIPPALKDSKKWIRWKGLYCSCNSILLMSANAEFWTDEEKRIADDHGWNTPGTSCPT